VSEHTIASIAAEQNIQRQSIEHLADEVHVVGQNVDQLCNVVYRGNGRESLLARVARVEQKCDDANNKCKPIEEPHKSKPMMILGGVVVTLSVLLSKLIDRVI
jgi:hypothetical protein